MDTFLQWIDIDEAVSDINISMNRWLRKMIFFVLYRNQMAMILQLKAALPSAMP